MFAFYVLSGILALAAYIVLTRSVVGVRKALARNEIPARRFELGMLSFLRTGPSNGKLFVTYLMPALVLFLFVPVPFLFTVPSLVLAIYLYRQARRIADSLRANAAPPAGSGNPGGVGRPGAGEEVESVARIDS